MGVTPFDRPADHAAWGGIRNPDLKGQDNYHEGGEDIIKKHKERV